MPTLAGKDLVLNVPTMVSGIIVVVEELGSGGEGVKDAGEEDKEEEERAMVAMLFKVVRLRSKMVSGESAGSIAIRVVREGQWDEVKTGMR